MNEDVPVNKSKNKNFLIDNKYKLKEYALKNREIFGRGIVVVNLLLLKADTSGESSIFNFQSDNQEDPTIHQPVSYIPKQNFWFKMLNLKIKKKYQIDIQEQSEAGRKLLVVFIKDASIEHFSIYTLKLDDREISST